MRRKRTTFAAVVAAATFLGSAGTALADGASENISHIQAGFSPNNQSATAFGGGSLFTQVQTIGHLSQGGLANKATEQVFIDFDNDIKFDTTRVPGCTANLAGTTTAQAITACKSSIIGSGQANAQLPVAPPNDYVQLTVTAFDGPNSVPGPACLAPGDNVGGPPGCDFLGGNPTIILHARVDGLATTQVVLGELIDSPLGGDFGKRLVVTDAPDTANDAGSLTLFNATIDKTVKETSTKTKKKRKKRGRKIIITKTKTTTTKEFPYVSARCQDDGVGDGGREWDFRATWVYDDASSESENYAQKCNV